MTEGRGATGSTRVPSAGLFIALVIGLAGAAALLWPAAGGAASASCGLPAAAFCETFDEGPSAIRGRGGDLDPAKWSAARLAPSDFSGFGPVANPVAVAPIPACKASFAATTVYPARRHADLRSRSVPLGSAHDRDRHPELRQHLVHDPAAV